MDRKQKINLLVYALVSAISFAYLVLPERAGISVPIFAVLQFLLMFWIYKEHKIANKNGLWLFIPIFILALNSFTSGNDFLRIPNFLVCILLYSVIILITTNRFPAKEISPRFIYNTMESALEPLGYFDLPFKWCAHSDKEKTKIAKKVLIGVLVAVPCTLFLIIMLSSADAVFSSNIRELSFEFFKNLNFNFVFKAFFGTAVGFYLFGLIYIVFAERKAANNREIKRAQGDLIIMNIILVSILFVYTIFVVIQFKYLFAGAELPNGLNYAEYARRGFFELIALSGLNVGLILMVVYLLRDKVYGNGSVWSSISKGLMLYLCAVTLLMLVSSFYRMSLYDSEYGFTQLRVLVYGFLIFEAMGILITFAYILKPKFNIMLVYVVIGLCYYLTLNVVNIDSIIAKRNVDRYFTGEKADIVYTMSLSVDAAPDIARLMAIEDKNNFLRQSAIRYIKSMDSYYGDFVPRWQRYNLSYEKVRQISEGLAE